MKFLKPIIFLLFIAVGCSSPEENNYNEYQGVWKRIGTIKYENQVAVDTFFFPEGKVFDWSKMRKNQIEAIPGGRYKIYGDGHSIWFYSRVKKRKDSLNNVTEVNQEMFAKTTYFIKNDSLFETFKFWGDPWQKGSQSASINSMKSKVHYRAKVDIDGDIYSQYRLSADGSISYGELYKRIDTYNVSPTSLTGVWNRHSTIPIRGGERKDSIKFESKDMSSVGSSLIFGDTMRIWAFNREVLDSLGNDIYAGAALVTSYSINNDSINDNLIYSTLSSRRNWKSYNNNRTRKMVLDGNLLSIELLSKNRERGQISIFEKQ